MKRLTIMFLSVVFVVLAFVPFLSVHAVPPVTPTPPPGKSEYALPYPGITVDNPLYFLKNIRDSIMELLIADPSKKVEYYILQSDKDINAGVFLDAKGKPTLAVDSIVKANAATAKALATINSLAKQGRELPVFVIERLARSLVKHDEVATELLGKAAEGQKAQYTSVRETIRGFAAEVAKLQK